MKVTIIDGDEKRHAATVPYNGADHVTIASCPSCAIAPCLVAGTGISHRDHDTYYAAARTRCCDAAMKMETKVSTIFGIDEDERVLAGRARVY